VRRGLGVAALGVAGGDLTLQAGWAAAAPLPQRLWVNRRAPDLTGVERRGSSGNAHRPAHYCHLTKEIYAAWDVKRRVGLLVLGGRHVTRVSGE